MVLPLSEKNLFENISEYSKTKELPNEYTLVVPTFSDGLIFDSNFESGNLKKVMRVNSTEYQLLLQEDFNTKGHLQWFYFRVKSMLPQGTAVRFSILNMVKPQSLYSMGMKPFVYSKQDFARNSVGWVNDGYDVGYFQNEIIRKKFSKGGKTYCVYYYTLHFSYKLKYDNDEIFFSQFIPWTYTDLMKYLYSIRTNEHIRIDNLCNTFGGNKCPMLVITDNVSQFLPFISILALINKSPSSKKIFNLRVDRVKKYIASKKIVRKKKQRYSEASIFNAKLGKCTQEYIEKHAFESICIISQVPYSLLFQFKQKSSHPFCESAPWRSPILMDDERRN